MSELYTQPRQIITPEVRTFEIPGCVPSRDPVEFFPTRVIGDGIIPGERTHLSVLSPDKLLEITTQLFSLIVAQNWRVIGDSCMTVDHSAYVRDLGFGGLYSSKDSPDLHRFVTVALDRTNQSLPPQDVSLPTKGN